MSESKADQRSDDELQQRVCRACNATYRYPVPCSLATRFYCEACMELPASVRAAFEQMNKRIKALSSRLDKLEKQPAARRSGP